MKKTLFDDQFILTISSAFYGICANIPIAYVFSKDQSSYDCDDWLLADLVITTTVCYSECSDECKLAINNVYSTCPLDGNVTFFNTTSVNVTDILGGIASNRSEECNEYIMTQGYLDGSADSATMDPDTTPGVTDSMTTDSPTISPSPTAPVASAPATAAPESTSAVVSPMIIPKILIGSLFSLNVWFCL